VGNIALLHNTPLCGARTGLTIGKPGNAWGAAPLGAKRPFALEYQNTPLLVFHIFRLFTTRQNCRVFILLPVASSRCKENSAWHFKQTRHLRLPECSRCVQPWVY